MLTTKTKKALCLSLITFYAAFTHAGSNSERSWGRRNAVPIICGIAGISVALLYLAQPSAPKRFIINNEPCDFKEELCLSVRGTPDLEIQELDVPCQDLNYETLTHTAIDKATRQELFRFSVEGKAVRIFENSHFRPWPQKWSPDYVSGKLQDEGLTEPLIEATRTASRAENLPPFPWVFQARSQ